MAALTHGADAYKLNIQGRGPSFDGDARGIASAIHADALQQWRQTVS